MRIAHFSFGVALDGVRLIPISQRAAFFEEGSLPFQPVHSGNVARQISSPVKVFLSHSTKDKQFVQALATELKAEKIDPWLCEVDIEFGHNFVAKIEEGLRDADLTVLFWSPEAARSTWTQLEWTSVIAREISESRT